MVTAPTYAELEDDDDGEDGPDGVLGEVMEGHPQEDEEGDDGEGEAHLGGEHDLTGVRPTELPALDGQPAEASPRGCGPVGEAVEAATLPGVRFVVEDGGGEEPFLAPLLEVVMKGFKLGGHPTAVVAAFPILSVALATGD